MTQDYHTNGVSTARRVLIVDDDAVTRQMFQRYLENRGFQVAVAADGREALGCLKSGRVDLVVTDVRMPVMNGVEFIYRMRQEPAYQHIPVLVISSDTWVSLNALLAGKGVGGVLHKPLDLHDLVARVKQSMEEIATEGHGRVP